MQATDATEHAAGVQDHAPAQRSVTAELTFENSNDISRGRNLESRSQNSFGSNSTTVATSTEYAIPAESNAANGKRKKVQRVDSSVLQREVLASEESSIRTLQRSESSFYLGLMSSSLRNYTEPKILEFYFWTKGTGMSAPMIALVECVANWMLATMLGTCGLLWTWMFTSVLDWSGDSRSGVVFILLGSVVSSWSFAQFASFAIQTSGHQSLWGLQVALRKFGPAMLGTMAVGWLLAWVADFQLRDWRVTYQALLVVSPCLLGGLLCKMHLKLRYFRKREELGVNSVDDAFAYKLQREAEHGARSGCPFQALHATSTAVEMKRPTVCLFFCGTFIVGLRSLILLADEVGNAHLQSVVKASILLLSLLLYYVGAWGVAEAIRRGCGALRYSYKMCALLYFIYANVTNAQIRVLIVGCDGVERMLFSLAHPLLLFLLRMRGLYTFVGSFERLRELAHCKFEAEQAGGALSEEESEEMARAEEEATRATLNVSASLLCASLTVTMVSGMACITQHTPGMDPIGTCPLGLVRQIALDCAPVWVLTALEYAIMVVRYRLPCAYFYALLLDPFLVAGLVVCGFLNVSAILLSALVTL